MWTYTKLQKLYRIGKLKNLITQTPKFQNPVICWNVKLARWEKISTLQELPTRSFLEKHVMFWMRWFSAKWKAQICLWKTAYGQSYSFFLRTDVDVYKIAKISSDGKARNFNNTHAKVPKLSLLVLIETLVSLVEQFFQFSMSFQTVANPQVWYRVP